jgi:Ca-activated chloride channel family protein
MLKKIILLIIIISAPIMAQKDKKLIREGNKLYEQQKYDEAEIQYMKANEKKESHIADFNIADALYKQGKFKEAAERFEELSAADLIEEKLASVYHNLGNSYLQSKEFEKSIDAYKNALRRNPDDDDTRYNLEYARKMLQQQQQQQQQQNQDDKNNENKENQDKKDNQDQQDKNKDNQDKNKQEDKKEGDDKNDQQQQGDKEEQNKDEQQQQQGDKKDEQHEKQQQQQQAQKREGKISKEDAERMLQALQEQERKLLKNLKKQKGESQNLEKNW